MLYQWALCYYIHSEVKLQWSLTCIEVAGGGTIMVPTCYQATSSVQMNNGCDLVAATFQGLLPPLVYHMTCTGLVMSLYSKWYKTGMSWRSGNEAILWQLPAQAQVEGFIFTDNQSVTGNFLEAHWWLGINNVYFLNPAWSCCDNTITWAITLSPKWGQSHMCFHMYMYTSCAC